MNLDSAHVLYEDANGHRCLTFSNLVTGDGIQSNQFLLVNPHHAALIDPGGDLTYTPLNIALSRHVKLSELDYVIASHQDPDIISSLPRWLVHTPCKVVCSKLWSRFLPHLASQFMTGKMQSQLEQRLIELPDQGGVLPFGSSELVCLPAHFLHSVGNFHFYDPVSKILFSGDMGASLVDKDAHLPVEDFAAHIPSMEGFHKRYMCSQKATRLWANMIRSLDVEMIVPQHGKPFKGKAMVEQFLQWISQLPCGVDLIDERFYRVPTQR